MKKLISVILVFGMLNVTFTGCKSSKLLSIDEASQKQHRYKYLILHDQKKNYILNNYEFTDTKLKGELTKISKKGGYNIHVYTSLSFEFEVVKNSSQYFEMDKSNISKITYTKNNTGATILLIAGGLVGIFIVAVVHDLNVNGL